MPIEVNIGQFAAANNLRSRNANDVAPLRWLGEHGLAPAEQQRCDHSRNVHGDNSCSTISAGPTVIYVLLLEVQRGAQQRGPFEAPRSAPLAIDPILPLERLQDFKNFFGLSSIFALRRSSSCRPKTESTVWASRLIRVLPSDRNLQ